MAAEASTNSIPLAFFMLAVECHRNSTLSNFLTSFRTLPRFLYDAASFRAKANGAASAGWRAQPVFGAVPRTLVGMGIVPIRGCYGAKINSSPK